MAGYNSGRTLGSFARESVAVPRWQVWALNTFVAVSILNLTVKVLSWLLRVVAS